MDKTSTIELSTGNQMPVIGLGTWKLTSNTAEVIQKALEMGWPMIDTSGDYGTQPGIGEGIRKSRIDRRDIFICTKVEEDDNAYEATQQNLEELGIDYADLMLIHRPPEQGVGEKLWEDLIRAREDGLIKDIGVSNYSEGQIQELIDLTDEAPVVNQIEWTPFGHSDEMIAFCRERDIVIQAYSPLTRAELLAEDKLEEIASHYDKSPAQLLIRWNLQEGFVPLPKANQIEHLEEDLDVFDFEISGEDIAELNSMNREYSALGALPYV